jgi:hypothetical protein
LVGGLDVTRGCAGPAGASSRKTWTTLPETLSAKTGVSGLTSGTTYYFRVQSVTPKEGLGNFGQIVSLLVK